MLKSYKFILLFAISFNTTCYGAENNKQTTSNDRSKSFNNYPEKKSFFKNIISNNSNNKNNNNSNNKTENLYWNFVKEITTENNNLKDQVDSLKEENCELKDKNEKVQQKIKELTKLISELQKQIKNNNVEQSQDNISNNDCDSNTVASISTQCANLQQYNNLLLNFISNITIQLHDLELENAKKDNKIRYKNGIIKYLNNKNRRLYLNSKSVRRRLSSVSANTSYNNLSSYGNYKSYRNINYNKTYKRSSSMQKGFTTYNQLLSEQIKDLKNENNDHLNDNQSKNNKLDYQITKNQNSAIKIINNINYNNKKKNIIKNEEEAKQIFGEEIARKINIQNTEDIVGLGPKKKTKNKKHKKNKKQKKENNNINIISTTESDIQEEKQSINNSDKEIQNQILESNSGNNEEYKQEDLKEDEKVNDKYKEDEKIDYKQDENVNTLKNMLTGNNTLNNDISFNNNIIHIRDDLTTITEQDDNLTVITNYKESINKNKLRRLKRKETQNKKNEQFDKVLEYYLGDIKKDNEENENRIKELEIKKQQIINNRINELEIKKKQIINIGNNYKLNVQILKNTKNRYLRILLHNINIINEYSQIVNKRTISIDEIDKVVYYLFKLYKVIEIQKYNDILNENNHNLRQQYLLDLANPKEIIRNITKLDHNEIINTVGFMSNELYYNVFKTELFLNNGIKWPNQHITTIKSILDTAHSKLVQLFLPLNVHNHNVRDYFDNWSINNINSESKKSLKEIYCQVFTDEIHEKIMFIRTLKNKELVSDFNKIINIFSEQSMDIISIIQHNDVTKYKDLIYKSSETFERKLLLQYLSFYKLYSMMQSSFEKFIKNSNNEDLAIDKIQDNFLHYINASKGIK